jgi:NitT/TauT family transport system ATP-binding protein
MPMELFRDTLDEHFSDDDVQRQIETALNCGRYGDIFTYDSESDRLSLHRPADLAEDSPTMPLH